MTLILREDVSCLELRQIIKAMSRRQNCWDSRFSSLLVAKPVFLADTPGMCRHDLSCMLILDWRILVTHEIGFVKHIAVRSNQVIFGYLPRYCKLKTIRREFRHRRPP